MSQPVDAIVVEYYLGLLNGGVVADEIKLVKPHLPIVMVADPMELPEGALKSVDALVAKADGAHSVWAAVHFLLNIEPNQRRAAKVRVRTTGAPQFGETAIRKRARRSRATAALGRGHEKIPFSAELWNGIRNGAVQFWVDRTSPEARVVLAWIGFDASHSRE
jgi:hypothetical protein